MKQLVRAIDGRVNPGSIRRAAVRQAKGNRIEVVVPGNDPAAVRKIERVIESPGTLEFRILATTHRPQYRSYIERAKKLPDGETQVKDEEGSLLAWWVPVTKGRENSFRALPDIATRTVERRGEKQLQVLVVNDPYNVNGSLLTRAAVGERGERPSVSVRFNEAGAERFGRLTGSHLPDKPQNTKYHLGIVFDGFVYSAPYIMSAIFESAEISGDFTKEEAQEIVNALNAGSLPVKIRRVQPPHRPERVKPESAKPEGKS